MLDEKILNLLACPKCSGELILQNDELICENDKLSYPIIDGIPMLLIEESKNIND